MIPAPEKSAQTISWFDYQLGRRPSLAPAHLSRVLYIPRHDNHTLNLPIYEAGDRYRSAVRDALLGSTLYTTMLGTMETPSGDRMSDQVAYLAEMHGTGEAIVQMRLGKRTLRDKVSGVELTTFSSPANGSPVILIRSGDTLMKIRLSFPIPDSIRGRKTIRHPYFALEAAEERSETPSNLEWRIDPKDGILRYTLVRQDPDSGTTVCAIYHHMHWELSLSVPYSEGVLLLPESQPSMELESIVVASLLGILAQLRMLDAGQRKPGPVARIMRRATLILGSHGSS